MSQEDTILLAPCLRHPIPNTILSRPVVYNTVTCTHYREQEYGADQQDMSPSRSVEEQ